MSFLSDLLKIAEKKQFEPIVIEPKEKKEEERPLTKKQKREMEREKEWRERKEGKIPPSRPQEKAVPSSGRIPKLNGASSAEPKAAIPVASDTNRFPKVNGVKSVLNPKVNGDGVSNDAINKHKMPTKPPSAGISEKTKSDYLKQALTKRQEVPSSRPQIPVKTVDRQNTIPKNIQGSGKAAAVSSSQKSEKRPLATKSTNLPKHLPPQDIKPKKFPPDDMKPKKFPPEDLRPKQFPPKDLKPKQLLKPKQFPPADVKRNGFPPRDVIRKPVNKRRILDDDEEYDSEMDDFIDDGPEESEDYSKYISEIFGYDKSKYRQVEDEDDNMESSFSQQLKEEYISTKIGKWQENTFQR